MLFKKALNGVDVNMKYKIFDAHCDTLCLLNDCEAAFEKNDFHIDRRRMEQYDGYTQVFACFIDPVYKNSAMERFIELSDTFYSQNIDWILSIEGGEMITSLKALRSLARQGVRIAALTWNFSNHIASGVLEPDKNRGLTEFGETVVREMNRINMLIDYSHLNDKSFFDIANISNAPIIATHSNSRAVCRHPRNLTDEQFRLIVKTGGCAGINFYPMFLNNSGHAGIDDIVKHIEHFMSLGGERNIGIGADFDGVDYLPEGISGCGEVYKVLDRLLELNYTEEQVNNISHGNFERIFYGG